MAGLFFPLAAGAGDGFGAIIKMLRGETLSCASPRSGLERVMRYMAFDRTICERDGKEESPAKKGARGEPDHVLPAHWEGGCKGVDQNARTWK